jgi:putative membrane-bound dehydrogenase-like protein
MKLISSLLCLQGAVFALDLPSTPPVEPQNAAKTFHVLDGFEMQLIAAEPLVTDPVAITYDSDGRAYVCEMNDYPYTDKAAHKPSQENPSDQPIGKVRLLTDTDGDGVFDKASVFADGLSWPTGAACWKGGIFVTATPDVWYLKDTNDDGVADVRQKVFTGFKKLNVQAVMNNPMWGLDHRIYVAGGSNGGEIQRVPGSESVMPLPKDFKPLPIKRNDFSFDPSTGDVRLESGGARFGQTFDDWGNRFLCNIRNPCQHVVLPYRYLARNPYLVVPSVLNDCAEAGDQLPVFRTSPPEPWREFRAKRWVQEGSHLPKSELIGAGVVTSSSGITVYRGDAYPKEYRDFAFVADVAGNLFYRMKLVPEGVTFKAVQVDGNANFCTSDDLWFRPVNFVNAPDGCLHVCDMYREVIEHPWSIPDDIHAAVDLLRGRDRGRIWRLAPKVVPSFSSKDRRDGLKPRTTLLSQASTPDLVALLDHPNAWHRETAQRLLFERGKPVRKEVRQPLLQDAFEFVEKAKNQPAPETLAFMSKASHDPWLSSAVLSMEPEHMLEVFQRVLSSSMTGGQYWNPSFLRHLASMTLAACKTKEETEKRLYYLLFPERSVFLIAPSQGDKGLYVNQREKSVFLEYREHIILGFQDGMRPQGLHFGRTALLQAGFKYEPHGLIEKLRGNSVSIDRLEHSLSLLAALWPAEKVFDVLKPFFAPKRGLVEQTAAFKVLSTLLSDQVGDWIIEIHPALTPSLREQAITALLSRTDRIAKLLDAIEAKKITPAQLSVAAKATLGRQKTPALAERIAKLIGDGSSVNRKEVIEKYLVAMGIKERRLPAVGDGKMPSLLVGDAERGSKAYETACMVCHKFADKGNDVGPHLGTIKAWTAEQLVTNILDPNREVSPNFALYLVETNDGRTLSGLIASETAGNLTLKRADGGTDTVLRSEIKSLTSPGISLMPEGLEAAITPQQMADLIAYLKAP